MQNRNQEQANYQNVWKYLQRLPFPHCRLSLSCILTQGGEYIRPRALAKAAPQLFDYLLLSAHANNGAVRGERG
ncbi:MAG: hypothetical protein IIW70_01155, partial [Bacteroidales bacterium]|nr:hypothetical protein [Bacteroidales bacterium]